MKSTIIAFIHAVLASLFLLYANLFADGQGIANISYSGSDLYKTLSAIDKTNGSPRGHGFVTMHRGYLIVISAKDGGGGDGTGALAVYDVSDAANPVNVFTTDGNPNYSASSANWPGAFREAHSVAFYGDIMAVTSSGRNTTQDVSENGIQFWDMSNLDKPGNVAPDAWVGPVRRSIVTLPGVYGGDYFGAPWSLAWNGQYLYTAVPGVGLFVVDTSDVDNPFLPPLRDGKDNPVPIAEISGAAHQIQSLGNFIVQGRKNMTVIDITDPLDPVMRVEDGAKAGYSVALYGDYAFGFAVDKFNVYDLSDPFNAASAGSTNVGGPDGGYGIFQDDFMFYGGGGSALKVNVAGAPPYQSFDTFTPERPAGRENDFNLFKAPDWDFATPLGNLMFVANDHGSGSAIMVHDTSPDNQGPAVVRVEPRNNTTNVAQTARIGIQFSDQLDTRTIDPSTIIIREAGSANTVPGRFVNGLGIVNFDPDGNLKANTTYEIVVPANGVEDLVGNATETQFTATFSTGDGIEITDPLVIDLAGQGPVTTGNAVTFEVSVTGGEGSPDIQWTFGDGASQNTGGVTQVTHTYNDPGLHRVVVTVTDGSQSKTDSLTLTAHHPLTAGAPAHSSTIIYDAAEGKVWNVNTDAGTISAIDANTGAKLHETPAGDHPRTLAKAPSGAIWVANERSNNVTIHRASDGAQIDQIDLPRGSAPYGLAFAPNGSAAFLTLADSWELAKLDPSTRTVQDIQAPGAYPRGLAISADSSRVFVTRFISPANQGEIIEVDPVDLSVTRVLPLAFDQSADTEDNGRGVPNYLVSAVISPDGRSMVIPSKKDNLARGESRDGLALDFDNTVRTIASFIDLTSDSEDLARRVDLNDRDMAVAAAYSPLGAYVFVATQGSNSIEVLNAYTGEVLTTLQQTGFAPRGVALSPGGDRLFVQNFMSRDVKIIDVGNITQNNVLTATDVGTTPVVANEALSPEVLLGKQIFYNAADPRMSQDSYLSCASCHFDGGQDGQVWDFTGRGEGLRNTIENNGRAGEAHGLVHWSNNFDEIQDFENDIRNAFAGDGFLSDADFAETSDPLGPPKAGRSADLDALAAYVRSLDTVGQSPFRNADGSLIADAQAGQTLFANLNCAQCHQPDSGYTDGRAHDVGALSADSGSRLGGALNGIDTPTLLGLWNTGPYFHDGSAASIPETLTAAHAGTTLSQTEKQQLEAYLLSLETSNEPNLTTAPASITAAIPDVDTPAPQVTVVDGDFSDPQPAFNQNSGSVNQDDVDAGWFRPQGHRWSKNAASEQAEVTSDGGAGGLLQVMSGDGASGSLQVAFDAINTESDATSNVLRLQIFGVNGGFSASNWNTGSPSGDSVTILDGADVGGSSFPWTRFTFEDVDFGAGYQYLVIRFWTEGVDPSAGDFMAVDDLIIGGGTSPGDTTPPAAPTSLTAVAGDGEVNLDWDDNAEGDLNGYAVYRAVAAGGPYTPLAANLGVSAYTDASVSNGTTYYYVVTASDNAGNESNDSSEAAATPQSTGIVAYSDDFSDNDLSDWTVQDGSNWVAQNGQVEYTANNGNPPKVITYDGGSAWSDYQFEFEVSSGGDNDAMGAVFYYVDADNHLGFFMTDDFDGGPRWALFKVENGNRQILSETVGVSYGAGAINAITVTIESDGNVSVSDEATTLIAPTPEGFTGGTIGFYAEWHENAAFDNVNVTELGAADTTPPAPPSNLAAAAGDGEVALDWDDNTESDLDSYTVYRSTTQGGGYSAIASGLSGSAYSDASAVNGTTYYYVVTASDNDGNESSQSSEAQATPQGDGSGALNTYIEAEDYVNASGFAPFSVQSDATASGGNMVVWPNNGSNQIDTSPSDADNGQAHYTFSLSTTSDVDLHIRLDAGSNADDSFYYKLEGVDANWIKRNGPGTSGYEWEALKTYANLPAGDYTLKLLKREDGTKLDRIFLTSEGQTPQ